MREFAREAGAVAERLRIAQDLHDSLAHSLTRARARGRDMLVEANRVVRANRGPDPSDPADTLPSLVREAGSLGLRVDVDEPLASIPAELAPVVISIAREGLANAARHCPSRRVRIACRSDADDLTLIIVNVDEAEPGGRESIVGLRADGGLGLVGVRERVAACGGVVRIDLEPTFALSVRLPSRRE